MPCLPPPVGVRDTAARILSHPASLDSTTGPQENSEDATRKSRGPR